MRRFTGRVARVVVRLTDLNGPKGGVDKHCRIAATLLRSGRSILAEATDADAYAAVSQAAARLDDRVVRALTRPRTLQSGRPRWRSSRPAERASGERIEPPHGGDAA
jgi:ribosome-associated translation inhibitor RaiA